MSESTATALRVSVLEHELATLRKLTQVDQENKIDAVAALLTQLNRGDLDLLRARHPSLMLFVLGHYEKKAG